VVVGAVVVGTVCVVVVGVVVVVGTVVGASAVVIGAGAGLPDVPLWQPASSSAATAAVSTADFPRGRANTARTLAVRARLGWW
jgi:hypothetical protein